MENNLNLAPNVTHQPSLLGGAENMKLLFDDTMADLSDGRKMSRRHADAWETLRLKQAQNLEFATHLANVNAVNAGQTGATENQQSVSPVRTGVADNVAAGATPANRITDTTGAVAGGAVNSATAQATLNNVTAQLGELTTLVASLAGLLAQQIQNAKQA